MKEPLILIPGLGCTAALYGPQWPILAGGRMVYVPDHTSGDSINSIAEEILTFAPERFALCGLSMGGYIALAVQRLAPERVTRLALLDSSAKPATPESNKPRELLIDLAERGQFEEVIDILWQRLVAPSRTGDERLRLGVQQMAVEVGVKSFVRQQRAIMARPDARPALRFSAVPTLILVGEEDVITPVSEAMEMAEIVGSRARLCIVSGCGHLSTLESPERVNQELLRWLE